MRLLATLTCLSLTACLPSFSYPDDPCAGNGVAYSDDEAIDIAVRHLLTLSPNAWDIPEDSTHAITVSEDIIDDFLERNPGCCTVERPADKGGYVVSITYKLLSAARPEPGADSLIKDVANVGAIIRVDSCGNAYKI
tara:strand:- start:293 stop:703 length:411 start_codon:yes stop_codon:yes gene_type:complete